MASSSCRHADTQCQLLMSRAWHAHGRYLAAAAAAAALPPPPRAAAAAPAAAAKLGLGDREPFERGHDFSDLAQVSSQVSSHSHAIADETQYTQRPLGSLQLMGDAVMRRQTVTYGPRFPKSLPPKPAPTIFVSSLSSSSSPFGVRSLPGLSPPPPPLPPEAPRGGPLPPPGDCDGPSPPPPSCPAELSSVRSSVRRFLLSDDPSEIHGASHSMP